MALLINAHPLSPVCTLCLLLSPSRTQRSARRTAARTACAWAARAAARKAGRAQPATREPATPAAPSTAPARTASVNAARDGTESTAPLVGWPRFTLSFAAKFKQPAAAEWSSALLLWSSFLRICTCRSLKRSWYLRKGNGYIIARQFFIPSLPWKEGGRITFSAFSL